MRTVSRRYRWSLSFLLVFTLLSMCFPLRVHADGGAPNLAYISGTPSSVSVIDMLQGKVTKIISVAGDPHTILLSLDGRLLYVTQPGLGQVSVILAETGQPVCTARLPGEPAFLALDQYSNTLYAAGSGAARVTALDPTTCAVRHVFKMESPVYGLAVAVVATGSVTTRQGTVDAVDIRTRAVNQLLTGGAFGQIDYDALTDEVYVPDEKHNLLAVLTPVFAGTTLPKEPIRVIHTDAPPESVAITSDGQLGFIALRGGKVVTLDLPHRQIAYTVDVGGTPHFVITGLYPPSIQITPPKAPAKQASTQGMITSNMPIIVAYVLAIVSLILELILLLQRRPGQKAGRQRRRPSRHKRICASPKSPQAQRIVHCARPRSSLAMPHSWPAT